MASHAFRWPRLNGASLPPGHRQVGPTMPHHPESVPDRVGGGRARRGDRPGGSGDAERMENARVAPAFAITRGNAMGWIRLPRRE